LDITRIVADLKSESERLSRAIAALVGIGSAEAKTGKGAPKATAVKRKKRGGITPAGRKRLSEMMKKRWAARKRKGS